MNNRPHPCPHCVKRAKDENGLYQHILMAHGKKLAREFRPKQEREQSMGVRLALAIVELEEGAPLSVVDEDLRLMFPSELRAAERRGLEWLNGF